MKKVVISGASGDIGSEIAKKYAKEGSSLLLLYNNSVEEVTALASELGKKCLVQIYKCDLKNAEEVDELKRYIEKNFGTLDILINNAGIPNSGLLQDLSIDSIRQTIDVNLFGTILLTRAAVPLLIKNGGGKIVNISSVWGVAGAACESVYSATKAAIIGFSKAMAKELAPSNINVNCVAPGFIVSKMNSQYTNEEVLAIKERTPMLKLGVLEDVANAVFYLTDEKSAFITGQTLTVDGGLIL